jgi:Flp pilus assembly pilin Flp
MKNEIVIPIRFILMFIAVAILITIVDGWGGVFDAIKEIFGFVLFWGFVALAVYGLYKLTQRK